MKKLIIPDKADNAKFDEIIDELNKSDTGRQRYFLELMMITAPEIYEKFIDRLMETKKSKINVKIIPMGNESPGKRFTKVMKDANIDFNDEPKIAWHHGTCDCCKERHTLVCHFGYSTQPKRDYRMCLKCFYENAQTIMYGWMNYNVDTTISRLSEKEASKE